MGAERFANLAVTTLAAPYTAGGVSITVTSAALFPTAGVFRVRLGNADKTLFRVDSVAGAVFTGAAEAFDGNAAAGDLAVQVATRDVARRYLQAPDAGFLHTYSGVDGVDRHYVGPTATPLDTSAWAWVNQGTAVVAAAAGVTRLTITGVATQFRLFKKAAPATPWTARVRALPLYTTTANYSGMGIAMRESGTGKLIIHQLVLGTGGYSLNVTKYNSPTSFNATAASQAILDRPNPLFLRFGDTGVNIVFEYSLDGAIWTTLFSEARGAFFTAAPNEYGIAAECSQNAAMSYFGLNEA